MSVPPEVFRQIKDRVFSTEVEQLEQENFMGSGRAVDGAAVLVEATRILIEAAAEDDQQEQPPVN
jgi:hypothetical protein